ncbi:nucleotidyltransferase family protein [Marinimicrococcus flavescens]|uniref:Nucleotidyltransferase family protein n=1 Tax=Marinimicrococcus flavescens TaxID=3031815 RepID=A0AAP3UYC0_9PROT|nr:nucleotidyltransferase family protein [Marinimicrococcus flavescens]
MSASEAGSWAALVLAGSRGGADPVAACRGVENKCLVTVGGVPMLARVVDALMASPRIGRVLVVLDQPAVMERIAELAPLVAEGRVRAIAAEPSPSLSVLAGLDALGSLPVLVTTADHALLSPAILEAFLAPAARSGADIAAGMTPSAAILSAFPESRRTFWRFRDERYSGANLFAVMTARGRNAVRFWRRVEQDRKRPWRIARQFGWRPLLAYLSGRLTLDQAMERISRVMDARAVAVSLPIAEAAIDVDKPEDLDLVERIVASGGRA